jgi:amino acid transporter
VGQARCFALCRIHGSLDIHPLYYLLVCFVCLVAFFLNVRGLHVTKWLSGAGSLLVIVVFLIMVYLLLRPSTKPESLPEVAFSLAWPGFSLLSVNVFTKMSLFALSGLDQCSIFSEECRKPKNDVARSVFIAAPFIALMYIASTSAHNQEAVQVLAAVAFGSYCITYMLLFGAVVFGFHSTEWCPGIALRLGAFLALLIAALAFLFQLLPVGEVASPWLFAMKVTGAICATSGFGAYLYWRGSLRAQRMPAVREI